MPSKKLSTIFSIIITAFFLCFTLANYAKADTELIDWTKEDGIRIDGAVSPSTIYYNGLYYMYYTLSGGIYLSTSCDGLNFSNQTLILQGYPPPGYGISNPGVIQLPDGRIRMYYNEVEGTGQDRKDRVRSAISTDGVNFTVEDGYRYDPTSLENYARDHGQASVPDVVRFPDGTYWLYFVHNFYTTGPDGLRNSISAAVSTDGFNFTHVDLTGLRDDDVDPDIIILSEDPLSLKMILSNMSHEVPQYIGSATSSDGINWTVDPGERIVPVKPEEGIGTGDPDVIQISSDTYRMYYFGMQENQESVLLSATSVIIPEEEEEEEIPATNITGRVYDTTTENNVSGVTVKIYTSTGTLINSTTSNPYTFSVDRNTDYYLRVLKEGYTFPSVQVNTKTTGDHGETFTAEGSSMTIDIPIDLGYPIEIKKTANKTQVNIGEIVTYNISMKNKTTLPIENIVLIDGINNGFKYVSDSSYLDGIKTADPTTSSSAKFTIGTIGASSTRNISYQVRISTGLVPGCYSSSAVTKENILNWQMSNESKVKVWVILDPLFDTGTILGKVFNDTNGNGVQDKDEKGIAKVRLATEYGVVVETDRDGKFHIPNVLPGIHLLKVDPASLPEAVIASDSEAISSEKIASSPSAPRNDNYQFTTDNPYVIKMTSGLLAKVSFGVTHLTSPKGNEGRGTSDEERFFIVALADGTIRDLKTSGNIEMLEKDDRYDKGLKVDGRLAYYLKGKIKGKYLITSSLDTDRLPEKRRQRGYDSISLQKLFTNLDPDKYYPIYGDASTIDYSAVDTQDAIYVLIEWDESHIKWGSFNTNIPLYNRTLSGGEVEYKSIGKTKYNDSKTHVKGFYAISRQAPAHDEFLGTGGSLYYLRHRDVIEGSEKIRVEVRDRISKVVIQRIELTEGIDYEIDYDTGRIILKKPLNGVNNRYNSTIISNDILAGERSYLVVDYEYYSINGISNDSWGGKASQWIGNHIRVGGTYIKENRDGVDGDGGDLEPYELAGGDGTVKVNEDTQIDVSYNHSKETQLGAGISWDGGLSYSDKGITSSDGKSGSAFGISGITKFKFLGSTDILLSYTRQDPYFSATDSLTTQGTQKYIASIIDHINDNTAIGVTHITQKLLDTTMAQNITGNSNTHTTTGFIDYEKNKWDIRLEYQHEEVSNPITDYTWFGQNSLDDNDFIGGRLGYQLTEKLHPYIRGQGTISGESNNQGTVGLDILVFKDTTINIAETLGNKGNSTLLGIVSRVSEDTDIYTNLEVGNLIEQGKYTKTTYGQSTILDKKGSKIYAQTDYSSFNENVLQGNVIGYDKKINDSLGIGLTYERSQLDHVSNAINRNSGSISLSYLNIDLLKLYSKLELIEDKGSNTKVRQWLTSNDAIWYITEDISVLGKANWALTQDRIADTDKAKFHEMGIGLAYRPINFDKLNLLAKYSYITDLPPDIQTSFVEDTESKKNIYALEGAYDICKYLQIVGKFAYRNMEERVGPRDWTKSDTMLYIGRGNFHISNLLTDDTHPFLMRGWDLGVEYRCLDNRDSEDNKTGWLVELDKELFKYVMLGVGYNFTKYDDDLSNDDNYDASGWFVRLLGKY